MTRHLALIAGAVYLLTVVTSIRVLTLKEAVLRDPDLLAPAEPPRCRWQPCSRWFWRWHAQALRSHCSPSCAASTRPPRSDSAARTLEAAIIVMGVLAMLGLIAVEKPRSGSAVPQADCTT